MKKLFTLTLLLLAAALPSLAQGTDATFAFVDADGNQLGDGTTLTIVGKEEVVDDGFGQYASIIVNSGLSVKNTTGADAALKIAYTISNISNGAVQFCFPVNCLNHEETGSWVSDGTVLKAGETSSLRTEWLPADVGQYGEAMVTYQVKVCQYNALLKSYTEIADGPTVTVCYIYQNGTAVDALNNGEATPTARYTINGQRTDAPVKGVNIVRLSNGKTIKQIVK